MAAPRREETAPAPDLPPDAAPERSSRPDIEGLRGLAILLVVIGHLGVAWMPSGFVGVDVIFVISGSVITESLVNARRATPKIRAWLAGFYARRIRRLLPAAVLVLVAVAALSAWLVTPSAKEAAGLSIAASAAFVGNIYFGAITAAGAPFAETHGPVANFWSLGVEEQFYLIWPLLLAGVVLGRRKAIGNIVIAFICAVSFAASVVLSHESAWGFFSPVSRLWELAIGGLIALNARRLSNLIKLRQGTAAAVAWIGLAMVVGIAVLMQFGPDYPGAIALIPVAGSALIIIGGMGSRSGLTAILSTGPARQLGRWSYSWYLWHWPLLVLGSQFWYRYVDPSAAANASVWGWPSDLGAVIVVLSLGIAALTYAYVEAPARWTASWVSSRAQTFTVGAVLVANAAAAGFLLAATAA